MARMFIPATCQDLRGNAIEGAAVRFYEHGTTDEVDVYADEVGGVALAQPVLTDGQGHADVWVDPAQDVDVAFDDNDGTATVAANGNAVEFDPFTRLAAEVAGGSGTEDLVARAAADAAQDTADEALALAELDADRLEVLRTDPTAGLLGTHRAASRHATAPATWLVIGDSRPEGTGLVGLEADRWLNRLMRAARYRLGAVEDKGRGYIKAHYHTGGTHPEAPTKTGNALVSTSTGLGGSRVVIAADAGSGVGQVEWTLEGTHAVLCFAAYPLAGTSEYEVDGSGVWVEVNHHYAGGGLSYHVGTTAPVDLGGPGPHTLKWRWKSQGTGIGPTPVIEGVIDIDGDPTKGLRVLDGAHGGWTTGTFTTTIPSHLPGEWVATHNVSTVLIDLATNDWQTGAVAPAGTKANLVTLIDRLRQGDTGDEVTEVVLFAGWTPRAPLGTPVAPWSEYRQAILEVAHDDPFVTVVDALAYMPEPDGPGDDGLTTTGLYDFLALHPEEVGHEVIARAFLAHLEPKPGTTYRPSSGYTLTELTDKVVDPFAGMAAVDLGTDGYAGIYWSERDGELIGWWYLRGDDDAVYPGGGTGAIAILGTDLPAMPANAPVAGRVHPGAFGYVSDDLATFAAYAVIPTVINLGALALVGILGVPTGPGGGALWGPSNPEALAGLAWSYQGGVRWEVDYG